MPTLARRGITFPGSGAPPPAVPSLVQSNGTHQGSQTTHQTPWDVNTTSGNLLVAAFRGPGSDQNTTIQNTGWTSLTAFYSSTSYLSVWIAYKIATGTEPQFNWTTTQGNLGDTEVFEFSLGSLAGTLDKVSTADLSSSTTNTSIQPGSTGTLSQVNEIAIVVASATPSPQSSAAIDSGFTALDTGTFFNAIIGYKITSATTALNPTLSWTIGSRAIARIATFK